MALKLREDVHYTMADVMKWDESERVDLIEGRAFVKKKPFLTAHQTVLGAIAAQIYEWLQEHEGQGVIYMGPFAVRPFEKEGDRPEDVDTLVEPDISVICDTSKLDDIGCRGAPDFIVEVVAPFERWHDMLIKTDLYWRAGVQEYWVADPEEKYILVFLWSEKGYLVAGGGTEKDRLKVNILEDCEIDLGEVFSFESAN